MDDEFELETIEANNERQRQYYRRFVNLRIKSFVEKRFGFLNLKRAYADNYMRLCLIPTPQWRSIEIDIKKLLDRDALKNSGEIWSLELAINIAKEAARLVVERK